MPEGTSWTISGTQPGTDGFRIRLALERGDVRWDRRTTAWLSKNFDRTAFNQTAVKRKIWNHVNAGGKITGQKNPKGQDHEVFFYVEMELDGKERFIEFVIEPEEDDNPGIVIVSAHPPH